MRVRFFLVRVVVMLLVVGLAGSRVARAHVGSKDVFEQVDAGPYRLYVTIRTPTVIPGVAAIEVRRVGLELEETAQMPYNGVQPGTVIAQNPQQGAAGVERPSVSLLVSTPAPNLAPAMVMPQLTGMPLAAATALAVHAGLKVGPVQNTYSEAAAPAMWHRC